MLIKIVKKCLLPALLSPLVLANEQPPLKLDTTVAAPYQVLVNGELSGLSVSILSCVLKTMDAPYEIRLLPWARAVEDLRAQHTDGIFTAMPASALEHKAQMSAPFALEKWYWFSRSGANPEKAVIGGIRSSNQVTWLKQQGVTVDVEVNSMEQLVRLLLNGRVDRVLADERIMDEQLRDLRSNDVQLERQFSRYMPLGIYFSRRFLDERPGFLTDFNRHMSPCSPDALSLNAQERALVRALVEQRLKPALGRLPLLPALDKANAAQSGYTDKQIAVLDRQWVQEAMAGKGPLIQAVEEQSVSAQLRGLQEKFSGLFSEAFLVSLKGLNLAESAPTSDYYQADEAFFAEAVARPDELYIGAIEYDHSSARFQVKVSWAVRRGNDVLGVMAVGLNIEEALRGNSYAAQ